MDDDVSSGVYDTEVVNTGVEPLFHIAEGAVKLSVLCTGYHYVNGNGVWGMTVLGVTDFLALLSFHFVVVLGDDNKVWGVPDQPSREEGNKVVSFLLVHGFLDLVNVLLD